MFLLNTTIFPWDFAILLLVTGGFCALVLCAVRLRRDPPLGILGSLGVHAVGIFAFFGMLTVLYGSFVEPHLLVTNVYDVPLPLRRPLTIAVVSDMHVGPYKGAAFVDRVVAAVNRTLPDIVVLDGDFLFDPQSSLADLAPLARLRPSLGVFAVMGNHDVGQFTGMFTGRYAMEDRSKELEQALRQMNITVLSNENRILRTSTDTFAVAGVANLWSGRADLAKTLDGIPDGTPTILLSHHPDIVLDPQFSQAGTHGGVRLVIGAHTHGGQFRFPFGQPIPSMPTALGDRYDQGIFTMTGGTTLAITRGVGETMVRARLFAWPEVMVLRTK